MNTVKANRFVSLALALFAFVFSPFLYSLCFFFLWRNVNKALLILCFAFVCGVAAYFYVPDFDMDLNSYYRLYNSDVSILDYYKNDTGELAKADFLIISVFQVCKFFEFPCQSIAFIASFIYFGCIALISFNWLAYTSSRRKGVYLIFLLIFSEYLLGFTGVRYDNSVLLFVLSIQYFVNKRYALALLFSLLSMIFHFSMLPVVFALWFSIFVSFKSVKTVSIFILFLAFFFNPVMSFLQNALANLGTIGAGLSLAINAYVFTDSTDTGVLYAGSRLWPIQRIFAFVFILCLTLYSHVSTNIRDLLIKLRVYNFLILFLAFLFFSFNNPQLFMRLLLICSYFSVLLAFYLLANKISYSLRLIIGLFLIIHIALGVLATCNGGELQQLFFNKDFFRFSILF